MLGNKIRVSCSMILMLMMLALPIAQTYAVAVHKYAAAIYPTTGFCDETNFYILQITRDPSSDWNFLIGCVEIDIPAGWTSTSVLYVTAHQPNWIGDVGGGHITLSTTGQYKLNDTQSVWVVFSSIAPSTPGDYWWITTVYAGTTPTGTTFDIVGDQPKVTISCRPVTTVTTTETESTTFYSTETESTTFYSTETESTTFYSTETVPTTFYSTETFSTTYYSTVTETAPVPGPVYVFVGTPQIGPVAPVKPLDTKPAAWIDSTAAAVLEGMLPYPKFSFDTDSEYVSQAGLYEGSPLPAPISVFITSGGPIVNGPVAYYEQNRIAPVYWKDWHASPTHYYAFFDSTTDDEIAGTRANLAEIGTTQDYFMIERFTDGNGNMVVIVYGYTGIGTFAAALYFKEVLFPSGSPDLTTLPPVSIYKWTDGNGNNLPDKLNLPGGDVVTIIYQP